MIDHVIHTLAYIQHVNDPNVFTMMFSPRYLLCLIKLDWIVNSFSCLSKCPYCSLTTYMVSYYTYNGEKLTIDDLVNKSLKGNADLAPLELFKILHPTRFLS